METKLKLFWIQPNGASALATVETIGWYGIRVGITLDNPEDFTDGTSGICSCEIKGETDDFEVYATEEAFYNADLGCASRSLFPLGLITPDRTAEDSAQCSLIEFAGEVIQVTRLRPDEDESPNYRVLVDTLDMVVDLGIRYDGAIQPGYYIHCATMLHGAIQMEELIPLDELWKMP